MKNFPAFLLCFLLLFAFGCSEKSAQSPAPKKAAKPTADVVFTNAKVYTVDSNNSWAEAVAVKGNKIVYVGDSEGASQYIGDKTETMDLGGKLVLPGFVEGHFHVTTQGIIMYGPDLQTDSMDELLAKLKSYAEENPDLEFINGWGVRANVFGGERPTAAMLDAVVPDRPVFLWQVDGHSAWVNSKTMELGGLNKETSDPQPGSSYYVRDDQGNPTGYIVEVPAIVKIFTEFVTIDDQYVRGGMAKWFAEYAKAGITAEHDFGWIGIEQATALKILKDFEQDGTLKMRIYGSYYWNDPSIDPVPLATKLRDENQSGLVQVSALKVFMDGGDDASYGALFVNGYTDKPDAHPSPVVPFEMWNDVAVRADKAGLNLICHCMGSLAVRKFLDGIELAKNTNPEWDRRPVASHAMIVTPEDQPRFKELNATYDTTGQWMALDAYSGVVTPQRIGPERMKHLFPIKELLKAGANVSMGSDFPAAAYFSDYRPLNAITQAVTRQSLDKPDMPILGGEEARLTVAEAVRANTYGAAYGIGVEDKIGSLEVGKLADLIVLDTNIFEVDPHDIHKAKVLYTLMDGVVRHRDGM